MIREVTTSEGKTLKFDIRDNYYDDLFLKEIIEEEQYFRFGLKINPDDTVIDCGACTGFFTVLAFSLGAKVFSYEPLPENFVLLKNNLALNSIQYPNIYQVALDTNVGEKEFYFPIKKDGGKLNIGRASLSRWNEDYQSVPVYCRDFKEEINWLLKWHPIIDFLKMDVEGKEYDLLYSLDSEFLFIRQIALEFHGFVEDVLDQGNELKEYLERFGFTVNLMYSRSEQGMIYAKR